MRKYKVGITFNLESDVPDIWANGAVQNVIFLYQLFKNSEIVDDVFLVSWGPKNSKTIPEGFMLDGLDLQFALADEILPELDVLIEGALSIEPPQVEKMHEHGGKVVSYRMGPDYMIDMGYFLFDKKPPRVFNGAHFDAVWTLPHHENTCRSYFSTMLRCETRVLPMIWAPTFCDKVIQRIKDEHNLHFGYNPDLTKKSRRIASFEPNGYIFKTCFTPVLVCEEAYRARPELIEHFYLTNTYEKRNHETFFNFIGRTDLVRDNVMTVEARYQMPDFLSRYVDIVLAHQWENGLNYAYNDALYGGYPLVHNSKFLPKGVGYYYDQFDAEDGAKVLLDVIEHHDQNRKEYEKRANEFLDSMSPISPINIAIHERELLRLFE